MAEANCFNELFELGCLWRCRRDTNDCTRKGPRALRVLGLQLFNLQCFYSVLKLIQSARRCSDGLRMFEGQGQKNKNAPHINLRTSNVRAKKVVPGALNKKAIFRPVTT